MRALLTALLLLPPLLVSGAAPRFSTWYWLNSTEKRTWDTDFRSIAETGFTDLILCWGLDATMVLARTNDTRQALDLCSKHGLQAYVLIWHPSYNKLPRQPEFQQVDERGNLLFTFNLFHREWRATQWKGYLQQIAKAYRNHPALAGYLLDDTFYLGPVGSFGGMSNMLRGDFVSYSAYDDAQFRGWLERKYALLPKLEQRWGVHYQRWREISPPRKITAENSAIWQDWVDARRQWLGEWAQDTVRFIREADSSPTHEIILEDGEYLLGQPRKSAASDRPITMADSTGVSVSAVAAPFDAVCLYPVFTWQKPNALDQALKTTDRILRELRSQAGPAKKQVCAFWVVDGNLNRPPSELPGASEIGAITRTALAAGVGHVSYYAFRVGDWRVSEQEWQAYPAGAPEYVVTRPITNRFLCDRPSILKALAGVLKASANKPAGAQP